MLGINPPGLHLPKQSANLPSGNASAHRNPGPTSSIGKLLQCIKNAAMAFKQALPTGRPSDDPKLVSLDSAQPSTRPDVSITPAGQNRRSVPFDARLELALENPGSPEEAQLLLGYQAAREIMKATSVQYLKQYSRPDAFVQSWRREREAETEYLPEYRSLLAGIKDARNSGNDALVVERKAQLDCLVLSRDLVADRVLRALPYYQAVLKAKNDAEMAWNKASDVQEDAVNSLVAYWNGRGENVQPVD